MAINNNTLSMLNFRNCKRCGKPFSTALNYTICPKCMDEEAKRFDRTRDFIYSNPGSTEVEIVSNCDITADELARWIREEKIVLSEESPISYPCEACGKRIQRGHFCLDCKVQLQSRSTNGGTGSSSSNSMSMHYFRK